MSLKKKKKKKEAFDASLMGGYLPGVRVPVLASVSIPQPVATLPKLYQMPGFLQSNFRYLGDDPIPERTTKPAPRGNPILRAWLHYTGMPEALTGGFGAIGLQAAGQAPQAAAGTKAGFYPSFARGFAYEFVGGTIIMATLWTIMDPDRMWRDPYTEKMDPQFTNPQFIPEGMIHGGYV